MFQSTHPHGVRLQYYFVSYQSLWFQSTHPHGVRHFNGVLPKAQYGVSIHAPTWGATWVTGYDSVTLQVSIHAPTWGATLRGVHVSMGKIVSIHAPTWGATN